MLPAVLNMIETFSLILKNSHITKNVRLRNVNSHCIYPYSAAECVSSKHLRYHATSELALLPLQTDIVNKTVKNGCRAVVAY